MFPELPLDPPDDEPPECPQCDAPLSTARRDFAECESCGWVNEPDFTYRRAMDSFGTGHREDDR